MSNNHDNESSTPNEEGEDEKVPVMLRIRMSWVFIAILAYITIHMAFMLLSK